MQNLKKLTTRRITKEALLAYQEVQANPNQFENSTFEFIVDPDYDHFKEIDTLKEFDA